MYEPDDLEDTIPFAYAAVYHPTEEIITIPPPPKPDDVDPEKLLELASDALAETWA